MGVLDRFFGKKQNGNQNSAKGKIYYSEEQRKAAEQEAETINEQNQKEIDKIKNQLHINMHYNDLVKVLGGKPTRVNGAEEIFGESELIVGDLDSVKKMMTRQFCCWIRSEGEYYLSIEGGKLLSIDFIFPKRIHWEDLLKSKSK